MKNIRGTHALLTGGSRGLGPFIARALAQQGANLTLSARTPDKLGEVAAELARSGVRVHPIAADVSDEGSRGKLLEEAEATLGPVDLLVNNAGLECIAPYTELPLDRIQTLVQTNLLAPLMLSRLALPGMLGRRRGHVVMISSLGGKRGSPYSATYAATKAALIAWTSGMRAELRGTGVGVSVICPGFVSRVGMFADTGERAPRLLGTSTPEAVARAVVRAIRRDVGEIVVNPGPVRLMLALDALSPRLTGWVLRKAGVYDYYREQAQANRSLAVEQEQERPPSQSTA